LSILSIKLDEKLRFLLLVCLKKLKKYYRKLINFYNFVNLQTFCLSNKIIMKIFRLFILVVVLSTIVLASCKQDGKTSDKKEVKTQTSIIDSKEFDSYFKLFFKLSDENTATDLPYVNKFRH